MFVLEGFLYIYFNIDSFKQSKDLLFNEQKLGIFVENIVTSHLHKLYNFDLSYFNVDKKEIDFIVFNKAIEVKYRNTLINPNTINFVKEYLILSKSVLPPGEVSVENRLIIPVCIFLCLLEIPRGFL